MKKIFNWTFGGVFRTLGRILAYVLVGGLIFLIAQKNDLKITDLLGIGKVYAETGTYNTSTYSYKYTVCDSNDTHCQLSSNWIASWPTMGNISNPQSSTPIGAVGFRVYLSSSQTAYNANYTYQFKWRVCESNKWTGTDTLGKLQQMARVAGVDYNTSNSATNASEGDTSAVGLSITDDTSSNYCWYATFTYSPPVNVKYIGFYMTTNGFTSLTETSGQYQLAYHGILTGNDFRTNGLSVSYTTDQVSQAIQQQTTIINNSLQNQTEVLENIDDTLTDDNVDEAIDTASDFFSDFTTNTHGLTGIITAPLNAIESLTSKTCQPLVLPLPFVDENLTLPCMREIYVQNFGGFMTLYDAVTLGIVSYWIMVRIFSLVKDFKNPDHDEIEVVDL